jgi:transcriptional regulator with XRE-family HTH domain
VELRELSYKEYKMARYYQPTKEEVKEARLSANITQQECADMCMVTSNTWARYEQGMTKMPAPVWKLFEYALAHSMVENKPKKLTVYEQRRLDKQREADIEAEVLDRDTEAMKQLLQGWDDEPKQDTHRDAEMRHQINQLRIKKEMMITLLEEKEPRIGADARAQFPDFDNIPVPLLEHHISLLTPVYEAKKGS